MTKVTFETMAGCVALIGDPTWLVRILLGLVRLIVAFALAHHHWVSSVLGDFFLLELPFQNWLVKVLIKGTLTDIGEQLVDDVLTPLFDLRWLIGRAGLTLALLCLVSTQIVYRFVIFVIVGRLTVHACEADMLTFCRLLFEELCKLADMTRGTVIFLYFNGLLRTKRTRLYFLPQALHTTLFWWLVSLKGMLVDS